MYARPLVRLHTYVPTAGSTWYVIITLILQMVYERAKQPVGRTFSTSPGPEQNTPYSCFFYLRRLGRHLFRFFQLLWNKVSKVPSHGTHLAPV